MKRLQEITEALDKEDLPLDDAIKLFEEGLNLSKQCQDQLKAYETKVTELVKAHQGDSVA